MSVVTPSGTHLIQHLNIIVLHDVSALAGGPDWPGENFVYDPSSPGGPELWGTLNPIGNDPDTGDPVSGTSLGTRVPGGGDGTPAKRRQGGSGHQPSPNVLTRAGAWDGPRKCFVGLIRIKVTNPAPDFGGWNDTEHTILGALCAPYNGTTILGPTTAFTMKTIADPPMAGIPLGAVPVGSQLFVAIGTFLSVNVGVNSFATVIGDQYAGPGGVCVLGGPICPGSVVPESPIGTSRGAIIHPA